MSKGLSTPTSRPRRLSIAELSRNLRSVSRDDDDEAQDTVATSLHLLTAKRETEFSPCLAAKASSASLSDLANGEASVSSSNLSLNAHEESRETSVKATFTGHKSESIKNSLPRLRNSKHPVPSARPVLHDRRMNSLQSCKRKTPTSADLSSKATDTSVLIQPSTTVELSSDSKSANEEKKEKPEGTDSDTVSATRDAGIPPPFAEAKLSSNLATGESPSTSSKLLSRSHEAPPHSHILSTLTVGDTPIAQSPLRHAAPTLSVPRRVLQSRRINIPCGSSSFRSQKSKTTSSPSFASKAKSPPILHLEQPSAKKLKVAAIPEPPVYFERQQAIDILAFIPMQHRAGLMNEYLWLWFTELSSLGLRGQFDEILEKEEFFLLKTRVPSIPSSELLVFKHSILCPSWVVYQRPPPETFREYGNCTTPSIVASIDMVKRRSSTSAFAIGHAGRRSMKP
ncbi:hypothetical protein BD410DRAFT_829689 [Rickenella mellea]|uniref:Uncharacterized protein n=1 Tax=Rickenella mellea TaxID=50990 RepID=A0A4Y7PZH3_9AGAM|nr:hypothetical protein BD410DRAFT_829689 [Rickenella mellea]